MRRLSERADAEAVGARVPCADPKPPQIRKKIAQARETVSAVGATEVVFKFLEKGASHSGAAGASEKDRARRAVRGQWLREQDSNLRPLGYEPNELPTALPRDMGASFRTA